jgi:hypothetical protein
MNWNDWITFDKDDESSTPEPNVPFLAYSDRGRFVIAERLYYGGYIVGDAFWPTEQFEHRFEYWTKLKGPHC